MCPFAQRVWIALEYFELKYEFKYCDLKNKSKEFISAYKKAKHSDTKSDGKVPVLLDKNQYITESALMVQYLNDNYGNQDRNLFSSIEKDTKGMYYI